MAYLDLNAGVPSFEGRIAERTLGSQARLVVLLSRTDPLWSLRPRHTHSRLLRGLFGIEAPHHLADRRLEALRRYAVTYRLRDGAVGEAEAAALEAGFADGQLAQVRHMVDGARAVRPHRSAGRLLRQVILVLAGLTVLYGATAWLSPRLDSPLIAFVFVAVAMLGLVSVAGAGHEPARH